MVVESKDKGPISTGLLDMVLVSGGVFATVYAFAHHDPSRTAKFLQFHLEDGSHKTTKLELTQDHLIFSAAAGQAIRVDMVQEGDALIMTTSVQDEHSVIVSKVSSVTYEGTYAPLTASGQIVVNGVLASTYVSLQDTSTVRLGLIQSSLSWHWADHLGMAPFRLWRLVLQGAGIKSQDDSTPLVPGYVHIFGKLSFLDATKHESLGAVLCLARFLCLFCSLHRFHLCIGVGLVSCWLRFRVVLDGDNPWCRFHSALPCSRNEQETTQRDNALWMKLKWLPVKN